MNQVGANIGSCLNHRSHVNAGLKQLITDDDTDIAGSYHQNPFAGNYSVLIHQGLNGAGSVYPWKVIAGKREKFFTGSRGKNHPLRFNFKILVFTSNSCQHSVLITADDGGVAHNIDLVLVFQKQVGNINAPDTGMMFPRTKELVGLLDQLPSQFQTFICQQDFNPQRGGSAGSCQTGGATANNQKLGFYHLSSPPVAGWRRISIPSTSGSTQVRTLALPLTVIKQDEHLPMAQKKPRGRLLRLL